jgi:hypothetical protein
MNDTKRASREIASIKPSQQEGKAAEEEEEEEEERFPKESQ